MFGGKSKSYKKQLEQINDGVVDELREEASQRGANALVGLQIDHDQISGQNKEMFMVTATATAVRAQSLSKSDSHTNQEREKSVTATEVSKEERTVRLIKKAQNGNLELNGVRWRFLIENQIPDLVGAAESALTEILDGLVGGPLDRHKKHLENGRDYFLSLPPEKAKPTLYKMVSHEDQNVRDWALDTLEEGNMLDLNRIESMLGGDFYSQQKPALEILNRVDKPYYEPSDVSRLKELKSKIEGGFGKRGEVIEVEKSGMLSSGTKEVWQIKEGAHNPIGRTYCEETGLDIYGFGRKETRPEDAIQVLENKITALKRRFGNG